MTGTASGHEAVMSGHGYYNRHSVLQAAASEMGLRAFRAAAAVAPIRPAPQPLIVADYGCSQGQNSLVPMGAAIAALRDRTPDPVTVVHTDLPGNDFATLFELLAHAEDSYLASRPDVYALAAGRSFYDQVMPPGSVALGWSSVTTHWLSTLPCEVPGHVAAQASDQVEVVQAFAQRAADDWHGFVAARAAELTPDGRLVMVEPCAHPDGHIGSENMMGLMDQVLAELVADGRISADAAARTTLPMWMRTPDEYGTAVSGHPDLELDSIEVVEGLRSPLWVAFEADGDAQAYAAASVGAMRAWSETMLAAGIDDRDVLDAFFHRCLQLGADDPERLHLQVFHVVLDIVRV